MTIGIPNSQKAVQTRTSAPANSALNRARNMAQDEEGEPGKGSMFDVVLGWIR